MNNQMDYDLYVMSEIAYKDKFKLEREEDLFPINWYSSKNYRLKIEIIAQAIDKNVLIKDTPLYKNALINDLFN